MLLDIYIFILFWICATWWELLVMKLPTYCQFEYIVYFLLQILIAHTMCKSLLFVGTYSVIPFALAIFIALCLYLWWQNIFNWMLHIIMISLFQNALYMLTIWRNYQWMNKSTSTLIYQVWDQAMVSMRERVCVCVYLYMCRMANLTHKLLTESTKQLKQCTLTFCTV
jgi:hypothetical protein